MFLKLPILATFLKYEFFASIRMHQRVISGPLLHV